MGCFNTTCFASGQTIAPGERCVVLPLTSGTSYREIELSRGDERLQVFGRYESVCYPHAFWSPIGYVIKAEYDDYGRFAIDTKDPFTVVQVNHFMEALCERAYDTALGENECHDLAFSVEELKGKEGVEAWDYMWERASHEGRVFVRHYNGNPLELRFAVLCESAFNHLVAMHESGKDWEEVPYDRDVCVDRIIEETKKAHEDIRAEVSDDTPEEEASARGFVMLWHARDKIRNSIKYELEGGRSVIDDDFTADVFAEVSETGTLCDEKRNMLKEMMAYKYMMYGLLTLNQFVTPMVYASQDYNNEIGQEYAKFIAAVSSEVTKMNHDLHDHDD